MIELITNSLYLIKFYKKPNLEKIVEKQLKVN